MTAGRQPGDELVPVSVVAHRGLDPAVLVALVIIVVLVGIFGRLVPTPSAVTEPAPSPGGSGGAALVSPAPAVRLVSPVADVAWFGSTELLVRGVAEPGIRRLDVMVSVGGQPIGQAQVDVDVALGRQFSELVSITPPANRTTARLEVREAGRSEVLVAVAFPVEAGALLLPRDPSRLHGRAGGVLIVDVLVYGRLRELRGLITGADGNLIATGTTVLSGQRSLRGGSPRTVSIELKIPTEGVPSRAQLHLLGIDSAGAEVEHIDSTVSLSSD